MEVLEIKSEFFTTKEKNLNFIVKTRHAVAHGDPLHFSAVESAYAVMQEALLQMIEEFNTLIKESAEKSKYLR